MVFTLYIGYRPPAWLGWGKKEGRGGRRRCDHHHTQQLHRYHNNKRQRERTDDDDNNHPKRTDYWETKTTPLGGEEQKEKD